MRDVRTRVGADDGAITVMTIAGVALVIAVTVALIPLCVGVALRRSVAAAADAAALAASDTAMGAVPGDPCGRAKETAFLNKAELIGCEVAISTASATVTVRSHYFGVEIVVQARAEPQQKSNPAQS